ncbi:MAG: hypothetical protein WAL31_12875 [Gaiellaceae bacterium]
MLRAHLTRTRLGFVLAVAAGLLLGAVLGQPGAGRAAANAKPTPKTPPTISGAAEVGITLVASHGTWNNKPTSFHYQWVRCDATGAACLAISGATARIYTPTFSDVSHTLRVTVTAHNGSGSASASSAATAAVPPSGCPPGTGVISISSLTLPARLDVSAASVKPAVTRSTNTIQLRFTVTACGGRPVAGASVFATAVPYNQFTVGQGTTAADGTVVLTESRRSGFPASRDQRLLAVFVRAWKQGEPETGGVSSSRIAAFHFSHHH